MRTLASTSPGSLVSAALAYARDGWSVLPLKPRGKVPLVEHGVYSATTDTTKIQRWWKNDPHANIGLAVPPRCLVVDVDSPDAFGQLHAEGLELPATVRATTGHGVHLWYFTRNFQAGNPTKILPGIDIRALGSYVVAPPSLHANGVRYQWQVELRHSYIAPCPQWLIDRLQNIKVPASHRNADKWALKLRTEVHEGRRNQTLAEVCGHFFYHLPAGSAAVMAQLWASSYLKPPLPEDEVHRTIQSIASREARRYGG